MRSGMRRLCIVHEEQCGNEYYLLMGLMGLIVCMLNRTPAYITCRKKRMIVKIRRKRVPRQVYAFVR